MLVSRTTNRKVYRIVNVTNNYSSLRIHLDDYVSYSDGNYKHIDVVGYYNYYYQVDKYVEIDNSKTRYERNGHEFNDTSVVKITDINAALIYRAREEYADMQNQVNDKIYDVKQKKWDEFVEDAKNLLDNYHELLGILEKIEISKFGEINKVLKKLDKAADSFLEIYDEDENWTIDIAELISQKAREELAEDLTKESSQLGNIVKVMEELEDKIIEYRQGMTNKENIEQKSKSKRQQAKKKKVLKITTDNQSNEKGVKETNQSQVETHQVIDLDKWEKEKLENQTEVPPKGNN